MFPINFFFIRKIVKCILRDQINWTDDNWFDVKYIHNANIRSKQTLRFIPATAVCKRENKTILFIIVYLVKYIDQSRAN